MKQTQKERKKEGNFGVATNVGFVRNDRVILGRAGLMFVACYCWWVSVGRATQAAICDISRMMQVIFLDQLR